MSGGVPQSQKNGLNDVLVVMCKMAMEVDPTGDESELCK